MKFKILHKNEQGQSLIEVLVVGVVAAIMILALIMIVLNSLKNAQFAQNQTQATKLAQDTIDKIRILRDNNNFLAISGTYCFNALWPTSITDPLYCGGINKYCYFKFLSSTSIDFAGADVYPPVNPGLVTEDLSGGFSRQIRVNQPDTTFPNTYVNVIVTISWNDSSGPHSSQLETIITKPNYDCIQ